MWKKHSPWRKSKAQRLKSTRLMLRVGFPVESLDLRRKVR
jgi:hypothetical protein